MTRRSEVRAEKKSGKRQGKFNAPVSCVCFHFFFKKQYRFGGRGELVDVEQ